MSEGIRTQVQKVVENELLLAFGAVLDYEDNKTEIERRMQLASEKIADRVYDVLSDALGQRLRQLAKERANQANESSAMDSASISTCEGFAVAALEEVWTGKRRCKIEGKLA
jgi:hypothetical protein